MQKLHLAPKDKAAAGPEGKEVSHQKSGKSKTIDSVDNSTITVNPDCIPEELKALPQWVNWRLEDRGNGKMAKPPVDPKKGRRASTTNPDTWATYDQALEYYEKFKESSCCGMGFVFTGQDPFTGIDLDKCRDAETGKIQPWALEVINKLNSYTELSPSQTGLHIIIRGCLPLGFRRKDRIEMYDCDRFFTMTGQVLPGRPVIIEDRQGALEVIYAELLGNCRDAFGQGTKAQGPRLAANSKGEATEGQAMLEQIEDEELTPEDVKILHRLRTGQEGKIYGFLALGEWEEAGGCRKKGPYDSISEAELALMNKLARLTGGDAGRMKAIFLATGLNREKVHEHPSYLVRTIKRAITGLGWRPAQEKP